MKTELTRRSARVLVVDDHESNLDVAARVLSHRGYIVATARNAAEALRVDEAEGPFDLYVLDVMMPGMKGTELARRLRAAHSDAKILYYTGYDSYLFQQQPVLPENEAFIQKPVSTRDIAEAVSLLLFGHTRGPENTG
jgi:CheY-like chemotaxis protein